ncbi:hypothetical protein P5V15_000555 [Pogonomyrmex californicus]
MSSMQATATNVVGGQEDETAAQQAQPPVPNPVQSGVPIGEQQGPQQATQGQMTSTDAPIDCTKFTPDSEKCRFIQEYLVFLLHADKCQRCENQANEIKRCTLPRCKTMKEVLKHMTNCTRGKNCFVSPCSMSKSIINHWKYCNRSDFYDTLGIQRSTSTPGLLLGQGIGRGVRMSASSMSSPPGTLRNVRVMQLQTQTVLGQSVVSAGQQVVAPNVSRPLNSDPSTPGGVIDNQINWGCVRIKYI